MTNYSGPATVTTPDGAIINVTARLSTRRVGNRDDWVGFLAAADDRALLNVYEGQVSLPDGRESGFIRTGSVPGGPIEVTGSSGDRLL